MKISKILGLSLRKQMSLDVVIDSISKTFPLAYDPFALIAGKLWKKRNVNLEEIVGFRALSNINLKFEAGKTIGIIGLNGSGKSTLLQIIAGTLRPDFGSVEKPKNTHALLELGSGFNPDFSGLENAKLICNLYETSFDGINNYLRDVEHFADIGDFFSRPVRTYSSGMMARVAFAVHANLTPDLFIIDEAIAVGDLPFQTKCFSFLRNLASSGSTIIFVSHDIPLMRSFCDEVVYLEEGRLVSSGDPIAVCDEYVTRAMLGNQTDQIADEGDFVAVSNPEKRPGNGKARFVKLAMGSQKPLFNYGDKVRFFAEIEVLKPIENLNYGFTILDKTGQGISYTDSMLDKNSLGKLKAKDKVNLNLEFDCIFTQGYYTVCLVLSECVDGCSVTLDFYPQAIGFEVYGNINKIHAFCKLGVSSEFFLG